VKGLIVVEFLLFVITFLTWIIEAYGSGIIRETIPVFFIVFSIIGAGASLVVRAFEGPFLIPKGNTDDDFFHLLERANFGPAVHRYERHGILDEEYARAFEKRLKEKLEEKGPQYCAKCGTKLDLMKILHCPECGTLWNGVFIESPKKEYILEVNL
jgi:hypothetical protein